MPNGKLITTHYTHGSLLEAIAKGVEKMGKTTDEVGIDDLGPIDEFHIGGRVATERFLDQLEVQASHHLLDVGCGLGGGSRFTAQKYGCRVTGVDLTPEYVETGNVLCSWVGLGERVSLEVGNASNLCYADGAFDGAYMMHVGMNISDKTSLAAELHRVVRPGGRVGIYDIMETGEGELAFPVPWASEPTGSSVASPAAYKSALEAAGFKILAENNRRDFALEFLTQLRAKAADAGGPPPLGLHILMGSTAPMKVKNLFENISRNLLAPMEMIAVKSS